MLKNTDVSLDLEGLGVSYRTKNTIKKIEFVLNELPPALERHGYTITSLDGFSSYRCGRSIVSREMQAVTRSVFARRNWRMVWSNSIADHALIAEADKRLAEGTMAESVLIVTNDHDFIALAKRIKESGRTVIVSGPSVNKRLQAVADEVFPFWEFLGGHPVKILPGAFDAVMHDPAIPNPIPLFGTASHGA